MGGMSPIRFYRLGLSTNPFFHTTLGDRADPGPGPARGRQLLHDSWLVLQLEGDKGAGKTHTAEWLLASFRARGRDVAYHHLPVPGRTPGPARGVEVFCLDEAQRARARDLRRLARWVGEVPGRRLILTTHEDHVVAMRPHPVRRLELGEVPREDLDEYLERRIREAALPGQEPRLEVPEAAREALRRACRGNFLRLVDLLYQACERLPEDGRLGPGEVEAAARRLEDPGG